MPSPAEYLLRRAIQLQHAGRDEEAIAVYRQAVAVAQDAHAAWLNLAMLLQRRGSSEACEAFAHFVLTAPADHPFVGMATAILREAGHDVPGSEYRGHGDEPATVQFEVRSGGQRALVVADNDSGVAPDDLLAVLTKFIDAGSWLDAFLVIARHPELLSGLASTLLEFQASQDDDRQMAHQAQVNLAVLARAGEVGLLAAFAEADQTPVEEFGRLVRARREIEPALQEFNGLTRDELWQRLANMPRLCRNDDTYLLLARYGESASDERRAILAMLRVLLERRARGELTADEQDDDNGQGQELAGSLEQAAAAVRDVTADQVARAGEDLLTRDEPGLSAFWRVEVARITAQCYLRFGDTTNDLAALACAEGVLGAVAGLAVPGSWQDAAVTVTDAHIAIARCEMSGSESALVLAADRLTAARSRVGRYRSPEAPILRALGSVTTLRAEHTGDIGLLRDAVELFAASDRITLRDGMPSIRLAWSRRCCSSLSTAREAPCRVASGS